MYSSVRIDASHDSAVSKRILVNSEAGSFKSCIDQVPIKYCSEPEIRLVCLNIVCWRSRKPKQNYTADTTDGKCIVEYPALEGMTVN